MSIAHHPGKDPLAPPAPRSWGLILPERQMCPTLRLVLSDRSISFPVADLRRWEHVAGDPELLTILTSREAIEIEGRLLAEVRQALDELRLKELKINGVGPQLRDGPVVQRITLRRTQA